MTAESSAARSLVDLYDQRIRLAHALAATDQPTGAMVQTVLEAGRRLDDACEEFRRRFYPRRAQVIVALRQVMVCSATRRNVETIYEVDR